MAQSAPAVRPLSQWIDQLTRARLAAKKGPEVKKRQRALTESRMAGAEFVISEIVDSSDVIGRGLMVQDYGNEDTFFLLVSLPAYRFRQLCEFGAEREDLEDSNDREPTEADEGEPTLGRTERTMQPEEIGRDDAEPDLGSTCMTDRIHPPRAVFHNFAISPSLPWSLAG